MLLRDPVIMVNHPLPQGPVGEQLHRLVSGFFDDLIFQPGQALLIIIPDLISRRDHLEMKDAKFSYYSFGFFEVRS